MSTRKNTFISHIIAITIFLLAIPSLGLCADPSEYKIATVDITKILNESNEAKAKKIEVDKKADAARKELEGKRDVLQAAGKKLQDTKDPKEIEKFKKDQQEFATTMRAKDDELQKQIGEFNKQLTDKAMKIIEAYAKENGISLVLYKGDKPRGPVLYGEAGDDITAEILKKING